MEVRCDGDCGFDVVAEHLGLCEYSHSLIDLAFLRALNLHKSDYMPIFDHEEDFKYIRDGLYPPKLKSGIAMIEK